jgi:hypothetical protein
MSRALSREYVVLIFGFQELAKIVFGSLYRWQNAIYSVKRCCAEKMPWRPVWAVGYVGTGEKFIGKSRAASVAAASAQSAFPANRSISADAHQLGPSFTAPPWLEACSFCSYRGS